MRMLVAVVALVGCGRVAFEPTDGGSMGDSFVAPCTGNDEDGDAWPDACDNCPSEPNGDQRDDGDADGIGDACDPRPTLAGDHVFFFDTFETADPRYTFFQDRAYPGNGRLQLGAVTSAGQAFFDTPTTVTRVDVAYEVIAYPQTGTQWIGVWTDVGPEPFKLFSETAWDASSSWVLTRIKEMTATIDRYSVDIETLGPWVTGQRYRSVTDLGSTYRFTLTSPGMPPRTTELAMTNVRGDRAFLEAEQVRVEFEYLLVYFVP